MRYGDHIKERRDGGADFDPGNVMIRCATCHGRVDQMPLMYKENTLYMNWCINCHRDPAPNLRPLEHITDMGWTPDVREAGDDLVAQYGIRIGEITHCYVCHR